MLALVCIVVDVVVNVYSFIVNVVHIVDVVVVDVVVVIEFQLFNALK